MERFITRSWNVSCGVREEIGEGLEGEFGVRERVITRSWNVSCGLGRS